MRLRRAVAPRTLFVGLLLAGLLLAAPGIEAQQIQVNSADPPAAPQGTVNLNVRILGKGFKNGANSKFYRTGTADPDGITVNSTTFISGNEVVANVDVADTASIDKFDIEVRNADGRTGKGIEKFAVTEKGGGPQQTTYTITLRNAPGDRVRSNVSAHTATESSYGFTLEETGNQLEVDLVDQATITATPISPSINCGTTSNEPCILAATADKVRAVRKTQLWVIDCVTSDGVQAGLDGVAMGTTGCGKLVYFIGDMPPGSNGADLFWAARLSNDSPNWKEASQVSINRTGAASWEIFTAPTPSLACLEGDCAAVTRFKQSKPTKGAVIEGFFHIPFKMFVTKP
jgi:hypothetical protein